MANPFVNKLGGLVDLTTDERAALTAAIGRPDVYPAKQDLIREGDRAGPFFVILEGWACRYKILPSGARQILAYLIPGDACDFHAGILADMDHSLQTVTPARVATIERSDMDQLMDRHRGIAKAMYLSQLIGEEVLRGWIACMGRRTNTERVAHLMCELYLRARNAGLASGTRLSLPLSQLMLADSLGLTPVHLGRILKELRISGILTLQRGSLVIEDPMRLVQVAGFDQNYLHRRSQPIERPAP